jgi:hypothetical protein
LHEQLGARKQSPRSKVAQGAALAEKMDGPFGSDYVPDIVKQFVVYLYRHIR